MDLGGISTWGAENRLGAMTQKASKRFEPALFSPSLLIFALFTRPFPRFCFGFDAFFGKIDPE
ncbi:hypothetical protein LNA02_01500 [Levilactobacillus namurensis]|nr:hypothetical protein LNA02_01500 [Levilactobacillus namurensis]